MTVCAIFSNGVRMRLLCGLLCGLAGGLLGCLPSQRVRFIEARCHVHPNPAAPETLSFVSTFEAQNLAGEQIIYRVNLLNAAERAIPSTTQQFRDAQGRVAATKALMVLQPMWTFEDARVAIPYNQFVVKPEDLPVTAEIAVCNPDGAVLAMERVLVPLPGTSAAIAARKEASEARGRRSAARERTEEPSREAARRPSRTDLARREEPPLKTPAEERAARAAPPREKTDAGRREPVGKTAAKIGEKARPDEKAKTDDKTASRTTAAPREKPPAAKREEEAPPRKTVTSADERIIPPGRPRDPAESAKREELQPRKSATPAEDRGGKATPSRGTGRESAPPAKPPVKEAGVPASAPASQPGKTAAPPTNAPPTKFYPPTSAPAKPAPASQPGPAVPATRPAVTPPRPQSPDKAAAAAQKPRRYVVQYGDTLSSIAQKLLGSSNRWPEIFELNRDRLESPDDLQEEMELAIPPK